MSLQPSRLDVEELQRSLQDLQQMLAHWRTAEGEAAAPSPQMLADLRARLDRLHPADIAVVLEALPLEERLIAWDLVKADRDGEILLEVSDAVRESLIASMDSRELVAAAETLEADEIADLADDLPEQVMQDVIRALPQGEREQLRAAMSYEEGSVGALMDFDQLGVRPDATLAAVTKYLRALDELPSQSD